MRVSQVNRLVKNFCEEFGNVKVARDSEFAYYYFEDKITYTLNFTHNGEKVKAFKEHIYTTYNIDLDDEKDFFLFSLLHEIGHYMTMDTMEQEDLIVEVAIRKLLQEKVEMEDNIYFKLPSEVLANDWAADYFMEHYEEVREHFKDLVI